MSRRKQIYKITYPNGKIYVGMDLIGMLLNVGSPSARDRIAADLDAHRLDVTLRKRDSLGVRDGHGRRGSGDGSQADPGDRREQPRDRL